MESRWQRGKTWSSSLPRTRVPAGPGGGPQCPRRPEEPPSEPVGRVGREGGGKGEDRTGAPEGEGGSHSWRDPQRLGSVGSAWSVSPAQLAGEVCPALGPGPMPSEAPFRLHWSWGHRREVGENRRGRREGPSRTAVEEWGPFALLTWLQKPAALPGDMPHPLRPEARLGLFCSTEPKLAIHTPKGLFQPCGS